MYLSIKVNIRHFPNEPPKDTVHCFHLKDIKETTNESTGKFFSNKFVSGSVDSEAVHVPATNSVDI